MTRRVDLWPVPAADLPLSTDQRPAAAWRTRGRGAQWANPALPPRLALTYSDWSWPIWTYDGSTPLRRVWRSPAHWDQPGYYPTAGSPTPTAPALMPWGPGWRTATAEDQGVLIDRRKDPRYGVEALNLRPASFVDRFLIDWAQTLAGSSLRTTEYDLIADALSVRTPDNTGSYDGRGMGGGHPKRCGILTADEVLSGRILHVLAVAGLTQWGPGAQYGPMAGRVEHPTAAPKGYPAGLLSGAQPRTVAPAGTRLVLPLTPAEIAAWCARRGHTGARARTATTIVRALGEFGFCHGAETGVGDPQIETSGVRGEDTDRWRQAGISSALAAGTLLDGLPWERLEVRG